MDIDNGVSLKKLDKLCYFISLRTSELGILFCLFAFVVDL